MANLISWTGLIGGNKGDQGGATNDANREDLSDLITLTDPYETPFFSMIQKGTARHVVHEWLTEGLAATATGGGTLYAEGASFSAAGVLGRTRLWNYCEIFRKDIQVSNTQRAVIPAGIKDEYLHQIQLATKEIGRDIEITLFQGAAGSASGSTGALRTMKTLRNFISTNSWTTSSTAIGATGTTFSGTSWALGETMFNSTLEQVFLRGGRVDTVFVNGATKRQISRFTAGAMSANAVVGISRRNQDSGGKRLVSAVDTYDSDFGVVSVILDRFVGQTEGGSGLGTVNPDNRAFFLQMDSFEISILRPLKHVPLPPGGDAVRGMVLTELTLTSYNEAWSAMVGGIATKPNPTSDGTLTA